MAGIAAAIAAARQGAHTLLIEKAGWLGGMGITGATGLHSFFNIFGAFSGAERLRVVGGIPYRALLPRGMQNLLVAGRMISLDLSAHNSTRNTVCCLLCGQAAGTAAAIAAQAQRAPKEIDVQRLLDKLRSDGALLAARPDPLS